MTLDINNTYEVMKRVNKRYDLHNSDMRYIEAIQYYNINGVYPNNVLIQRLVKESINTFDLRNLRKLLKLGFVVRYAKGKYMLTGKGLEVLKYYKETKHNLRYPKQRFDEVLAKIA